MRDKVSQKECFPKTIHSAVCYVNYTPNLFYWEFPVPKNWQLCVYRTWDFVQEFKHNLTKCKQFQAMKSVNHQKLFRKSIENMIFMWIFLYSLPSNINGNLWKFRTVKTWRQVPGCWFRIFEWKIHVVI